MSHSHTAGLIFYTLVIPLPQILTPVFLNSTWVLDLDWWKIWISLWIYIKICICIFYFEVGEKNYQNQVQLLDTLSTLCSNFAGDTETLKMTLGIYWTKNLSIFYPCSAIVLITAKIVSLTHMSNTKPSCRQNWIQWTTCCDCLVTALEWAMERCTVDTESRCFYLYKIVPNTFPAKKIIPDDSLLPLFSLSPVLNNLWRGNRRSNCIHSTIFQDTNTSLVDEATAGRGIKSHICTSRTLD